MLTGLPPRGSLPLLVAITAAILLAPGPMVIAHASGLPDSPDFEEVLKPIRPTLTQIQSDADALALYRNVLSRSLGIQDTVPLLEQRRIRRSRAHAPPPNLREPALQLTRELAAWSFARQLREAGDTREPSRLQAYLESTRVSRPWLFADSTNRSLAHAVSLAAVLASFETSQDSRENIPAPYVALADYLDGTYADLAQTDTSWLALAERQGTEGIRHRLVELWSESEQGDPEKQRAALLYFDTRLRPVFMAQLAASTIRAEAESERRARELLAQLRGWREAWSTHVGLQRLCGTWIWTVHNHQNHEDHKMLLTFPPPCGPDTQGLKPSKVIVLGDAVFLRWVFQDGYQEDSLLFSGKGKLLEGTFVNTRGPYGSITGKKTAPCPKQKD